MLHKISDLDPKGAPISNLKLDGVDKVDSVDTLPAIPTSRAEAEALLQDIALNTAKLAVAVAILDERLAVAREKIADRVAELQKIILQQNQAMGQWAWLVKDKEFSEPKSIQMLYGVVGFMTHRRSLGLLARQDWGMVLARLKGKFKKYVRVKSEVDRAGLLKDAIVEGTKILPEELSKLGLKIVQEESFYVELKKS